MLKVMIARETPQKVVNTIGFNPYQRFLLGLSLSVLLGVLLIVLVVNSLIGRFLISSTAKLTEDSVVNHVYTFFPNVFNTAKPAQHDMTMNLDPYAATSSGQSEIERINTFVHFHYALFNITDATFFTPDGKISYAYDQKRIAGSANQLEQQQLQQLETTQNLVTAKDQKLELWLRVARSPKDKTLIGFIHVVRDMRPEWAEVRNIEQGVAGVGTIAALGLFFVLRGVFVNSTTEIAGKNSKLQILTSDLEASYNNLLQAMSNAMDSRDHETADHTHRVTQYALRLGREMRLSKEELVNLERGALLHDIGKMGVPDAVLLKPGRLDSEELKQMQAHVDYGDSMLREIPFLKEARNVVRCHHERFDGNGYPAKLVGENIPMIARIFSVCDTYDAITSKRPYKKAFTDAEARDIILKESGLQFDPVVVEAFKRISVQEWQGIGKIST